jgi:hypothetical protein
VTWENVTFVSKAVAPPDLDPHPGAGLDVDPLGNLWVTSHGSPGTVYQLDAGLPEANDVPWLRVRPTGGCWRLEAAPP